MCIFNDEDKIKIIEMYKTNICIYFRKIQHKINCLVKLATWLRNVIVYSQSQHLSELRALDESLKLEAQKLARDYTYSNNTYFGDL